MMGPKVDFKKKPVQEAYACANAQEGRGPLRPRRAELPACPHPEQLRCCPYWGEDDSRRPRQIPRAGPGEGGLVPTDAVPRTLGDSPYEDKDKDTGWAMGSELSGSPADLGTSASSCPWFFITSQLVPRLRTRRAWGPGVPPLIRANGRSLSRCEHPGLCDCQAVTIGQPFLSPDEDKC